MKLGNISAAELKAMAEAYVGKPVDKPMFSSRCWATKRVYTGALYQQHVGCSKNHRPQQLTCAWHKDREEAARKLKARLDAVISAEEERANELAGTDLRR